MFEVIQNNKYTVGILSALILGLIIYYGYISGGSTGRNGSETATTATSTEVANVGSEVSHLLGRLQSVDLNTALFDKPAFETLKPFGYTVTEKQAGRENPFAPIGTSDSKDLEPDPSAGQ